MTCLTALALLGLPLYAQPSPKKGSPLLAGGVVRSKEWVIHRGAGKEEEFIGNVRYQSAGTRLRSDWALFKHAERTWQARGAVNLWRQAADGTVFEAQGQKAGHNDESRQGFLEPAPGKRVPFTRTPPGLASDHGESGRVSWNGENRVTFSAGAKVWGPRLELAADEAVYEKTGGRITLNGGRPVLRKTEEQWTTALKADAVIATETPRRVSARGLVKGWLIFKNPDKRSELFK